MTQIIDLKTLGATVRKIRQILGVTQDQLALTSGTNRRFVVELEKGKPTAQIGKVLQVLKTLGIALTLAPPPGVDIDKPDRGLDGDAQEPRRGPKA